MQAAVWDTYVAKNTATIYSYGREYLKTKGQEGHTLTAEECQFCHIEAVKPPLGRCNQKKGLLYR